MALAALGRGQEALSQADLAVELSPIRLDAVEGYDWLAYRAEVLLHLGRYDEAVDQLEFLLSDPGWVSAAWLSIDPLFDPLRDHPGFQALLEKHADDVEH